MYMAINYKDKTKCSAYGRNGTVKQHGLDILVNNEKIILSPITSRGTCNSCILEIPVEAEALKKLIEIFQQLLPPEVKVENSK